MEGIIPSWQCQDQGITDVRIKLIGEGKILTAAAQHSRVPIVTPEGADACVGENLIA